MSRLPIFRFWVSFFTMSTLACYGPSVVDGGVIYVDDDAPNDPGPGDPTVSDPLEDGSADHPFDAIQEGIDAAVDGDTVLVLDGTYTGDGNKNLDFGGRLITVRSENGPENCIIDCGDIGRAFTFHSGETNAAVVDGLTIIGGGVDGNTGGFYCSASSPTITNCKISLCWIWEGYGAGICCENGSPLITNCLIEHCRCEELSSVDPIGGGGIYCYGGEPRIIANRFVGCGASVYCLSGGGAICVWNSNALIRGNEILSCGAHGLGGGIAATDSEVDISNNIIAGCGGFHYGGGIALRNASGTLSNNLIVDSSAYDMYGGGIYLCGPGSLEIAFCTIAYNTVQGEWGMGGGIYVAGGPVQVDNCIVWGNYAVYGEQIVVDGGQAELRYCDVQDGWPGIGNIIADPLFVDQDGPDDDPNTWEDNDYHLAGASPCIDVGDPAFVPHPDDRDVDGQWRVWDGDDDGVWRVDMGCDEFGSHCPGDLDGDGDIDLADLAALLANYGSTSGMTPEDGDLDCDGDVDLSDLTALLAVYGTTCE